MQEQLEVMHEKLLGLITKSDKLVQREHKEINVEVLRRLDLTIIWLTYILSH